MTVAELPRPNSATAIPAMTVRYARLRIVSKTAGDSRGFGGATETAENRIRATEFAYHRSFLVTMDAGSIPAASTTRLHSGAWCLCPAIQHGNERNRRSVAAFVYRAARSTPLNSSQNVVGIPASAIGISMTAEP